jgi:calcineurin-like phosphoesterase family protein
MNKVLKIRQTDDQKVYWVSDTHLNHNRDFVYEVRGFKSSQEHTDFIINKINEIVRPNDILIHGGDFCLNTDEHGCNELMARIQCQNIYLLWGNHNNPLWKIYKREVSNWFASKVEGGQMVSDITDVDFQHEIYPFRYKNIVFYGNYLEMVVDGQYFVVAHYPIHVWNYVKDGAKMICGHSHYGLPFSQADNLDAKILDIGWDGYARPLSTKEVLDIMDKKAIFETGDHHKKS